MGEYKLSVIIPTYNAENFIKKTVDSLINQTFGFKNIELILVDDASRDSTKDILKDLENKHENIKCIFNQKNSGSPSRPRNIGIENATTDYIMFLDNDDEYSPDMCEVMYGTITDDNADIVSCRFIFNNKGPIREKSFLDKLDSKVKIGSIFEMPELLTTTQPGFIWNKIFKRQFLIKNSFTKKWHMQKALARLNYLIYNFKQHCQNTRSKKIHYEYFFLKNSLNLSNSFKYIKLFPVCKIAFTL